MSKFSLMFVIIQVYFLQNTIWRVSDGWICCQLPSKGASYDGIVAFTKSQAECDPWVNHPNSKFSFVDGSAINASNFCRNPYTLDHDGPWCYIKGEGDAWDYCDVCLPFCCKVTKETGFNLRSKLRLKHHSLIRCIHWCIKFLSCAAVDYNKWNGKCHLLTSSTETTRWDGTNEHYTIYRICPKRANKPKLNDVGYKLMPPDSTEETSFELLRKSARVAKSILSAAEAYETTKPSRNISISSVDNGDYDKLNQFSTASLVIFVIIAMMLVGFASTAYSYLKTRRQNEKTVKK